MGRTLLYDKTTADDLIARQSGLITRSQALSCGLTNQALRGRLRADGPRQVLIPGVYATFTGTVTPAQWRRVKIADIAAELAQGPTSGSARFQAVALVAR